MTVRGRARPGAPPRVSRGRRRRRRYSGGPSVPRQARRRAAEGTLEIGPGEDVAERHEADREQRVDRCDAGEAIGSRTSCCIAVSQSVLPTSTEPPITTPRGHHRRQRQWPDQATLGAAVSVQIVKAAATGWLRPESVGDHATEEGRRPPRPRRSVPRPMLPRRDRQTRRADPTTMYAPIPDVADRVAEEAGGQPPMCYAPRASRRARSLQKRCTWGRTNGATCSACEEERAERGTRQRRW